MSVVVFSIQFFLCSPPSFFSSLSPSFSSSFLLSFLVGGRTPHTSNVPTPNTAASDTAPRPLRAYNLVSAQSPWHPYPDGLGVMHDLQKRREWHYDRAGGRLGDHYYYWWWRKCRDSLGGGRRSLDAIAPILESLLSLIIYHKWMAKKTSSSLLPTSKNKGRYYPQTTAAAAIRGLRIEAPWVIMAVAVVAMWPWPW